MKPFIVLFTLALVQTHSLHAGPRTSANYAVATDSVSTGGLHATSASYSGDSSLGGVGGIATVASPAEISKSGYIGQLSEMTALQLAASPTTLNEASTRQLSATATQDDATTTALLGTDINWSVVSGPIASISSSGLATAANVYQDTAATVQGSYLGGSGTLGLTVLNTGTDDFGFYATDGIPDAWQVQYFGLNNPLAEPTADATGTGQNNLFKYTAGLIPTDPTSRFLTTVGFSAGHTLTLSPRLPDRSYTVQFSTDLTSWQTLTGATIQDNGQIRTLTDPDAVSTRKFYRVQITYP